MLFSKEEWDAARRRVVADMTEYLRPYRTAIYEHKHDYGDGWRSGSYPRLLERVVILTKEHIAVAREQGRFSGINLTGKRISNVSLEITSLSPC